MNIVIMVNLFSSSYVASTVIEFTYCKKKIKNKKNVLLLQNKFVGIWKKRDNIIAACSYF
jgi:hypothetical protein